MTLPILILNDGSTDKSGIIAEKISREFTNIRLFSHSNIGLSGTRNRGLKEACGDYIWFIDSDDWIDENCLAEILQLLKNDVDVLSFAGMIPEGGRKGDSFFYNENVNSIESLFRSSFTDPVQFYIYRREYLLNNNYFFKEGIKHEDTLFTPIVLSTVNNITFFRKPVYHLLFRPGSITAVNDHKRIQDLAYIIHTLYVYSTNIKNENIFIGYKNKMAHRIIEFINYGVMFGNDNGKFVAEIMDKYPEYWHIIKNAMDKKTRIIYTLIKISPLYWIYTYRIMLYIKHTLNI